MVFDAVRVLKIDYDDYVLRLEECLKDVLVGGSKKTLVDCPIGSSMAIDPYLVAAIALCLLVHLLGHRFLRKSPSRFPYPPGPRGLPILGALLLVGASAHSSLARLAKRYGPVMFLRLGSHGCVVASNADAARAFLKTVDAKFANRPDPISARDVSYQRQNLVMADYTPTWKLLRKMSSLHLLGGKAFAEWGPVRRDEFRRMARSLHGLAEAGEPVEVMDVLVCTLANVIGLILVSRRVFDAHGEESNKFKDILVDMLTGGAQFNIGDFFPSIAWMDLQGIQKKMLSVHLRFDAMVTKLFEEHEATKGERQGRPDFIDKVMANKMTEDGETISEVNVKALIFVSFPIGIISSYFCFSIFKEQFLKVNRIIHCLSSS
ncbi:hypothetical protein BHE74_00026945 [Ensete ventricosum]|nr:hypothetical protein BHE74_00026945 [Ensete ventricosum]